MFYWSVAGGMQRKGGFGRETLAERSVRMGLAADPASAGESGPESSRPDSSSPDRSSQRGHPFPKHVWVNLTGQSTDGYPGVLMDWRRGGNGGWEALVTWVEGGGMRAVRAHTEWVRAEHVMPA